MQLPAAMSVRVAVSCGHTSQLHAQSPAVPVGTLGPSKASLTSQTNTQHLSHLSYRHSSDNGQIPGPVPSPTTHVPRPLPQPKEELPPWGKLVPLGLNQVLGLEAKLGHWWALEGIRHSLRGSGLEEGQAVLVGKDGCVGSLAPHSQGHRDLDPAFPPWVPWVQCGRSHGQPWTNRKFPARPSSRQRHLLWMKGC